ncbi:MAG: hypothetical protein JWP44_4937 [Mucilaginibacter sp.]|nr:hypothetical protein [Mucilaginibacter sp.]
MNKSAIRCAAIQYPSGLIFSLPAPNRHHNLIWMMAELGIATPITGTQGFLDATGNFITREAAAILVDSDHKKLYSEDLW